MSSQTSFRPPLVDAGACDSHAHIFGDSTRFPVVSGAGYQPEEASKVDYLAMLASIGLERMVIVQPSVYGFDNGCTVDAVVSFGLDRARGVAMVEPTVAEEHVRELHAAGMRGIRFITVSPGGPDIDDLAVIAEKIAPFGWHIQMYVSADLLPSLEPLILRLPVPVVLDHMGGLRADTDPNDAPYQSIVRLLDSGRCWIKLSGYRASVTGPPYTDVVPLASRLLAQAPERCVWGTDWPHPNLDDPEPEDSQLLELLFESIPDDQTRQRVLVHNPATLYGFPPLAKTTEGTA